MFLLNRSRSDDPQESLSQSASRLSAKVHTRAIKSRSFLRLHPAGVNGEQHSETLYPRPLQGILGASAVCLVAHYNRFLSKIDRERGSKHSFPLVRHILKDQSFQT
jgi:hypothetical protein